MTTTVLLTPDNSTAPDGAATWDITGGASRHAVLADGSDATYDQADAAGERLDLSLTTTVLPAGSRVVAMIPNYTFATQTAYEYIQHGWYSSPSTVVPPDGIWLENGQTIGASLFTTINPAARSKSPTGADWTQTEVDGIRVRLKSIQSTGWARLSKYGMDVVYAVIPVVVGTLPSSPVTTTTKPLVEWSWTPDSSYPTQERYQVRVFTAAQYGIGGFDPATSPATWDSTETLSTSTSVQVGTHLTNGVTYRAYIRAGAQVNGSTHYSLWDDIQWTMSLALPGVPTMTVTAQSSLARIKIDLDDSAGAAGTDWFRVERSDDGGTTWDSIRGGDPITPTAGLATVYDYETGNGQPVQYRAQAVSTDSGSEVAGAFTSTETASWSHPMWWLKCPTNPALNIQVRFHEDGIPRLSRRRPRAVLDILSRADPVVVSDTRRTVEGAMTLLTLDAAERLLLGDLLDVDATLLLQAPAAAEFGSRYIDIGDADESRVGGLDVEPTRLHDIPFVEVAAP